MDSIPVIEWSRFQVTCWVRYWFVEEFEMGCEDEGEAVLIAREVGDGGRLLGMGEVVCGFSLLYRRSLGVSS